MLKNSVIFYGGKEAMGGMKLKNSVIFVLGKEKNINLNKSVVCYAAENREYRNYEWGII